MTSIPGTGASIDGGRFSEFDWTDAQMEEVTFDGCTFEGTRLTGTLFRRCRFIECRFERCEMSGARFLDSQLREAEFVGCRLWGVNWAEAWNQPTEPATLDFDACELNHNSFMAIDMSGRKMSDCNVHEALFQGTRFVGSDCGGSDFSGSRFSNVDLTGADFRGARNYRIDPTRNVVKSARFSLPEAIGLLEPLGIELA